MLESYQKNAFSLTFFRCLLSDVYAETLHFILIYTA